MAVQLVLSERAVAFLSGCESLPDAIRTSLKDPKHKFTLSEIKDLFESWSPPKEGLHLHELLENAEIVLPSLPSRTKSKELKTRLERLKKEQEEREYARMVKNVDSKFADKSTDSTSLAADMKVLRAQMIAVTNFLVSVGGTFAFMYKAVEYSLPVPAVPTQVIAGLLGGSIVALAELYFLVKHLDS